MDAVFDRLRTDVAGDPAAAVEYLCDHLRSIEDYHGLFYALLMKKRVELGVSPFPTGPSTDLPSNVHEPYEAAIREAARYVGGLYLQKRDIARAWGFYRLIGEPEPVRTAIENYSPQSGEDVYPIIDIAWQQQVAPRAGFELYLANHGICSAITMVGSTDLSSQPELRNHCIGKLANALHDQLRERLTADLTARGWPTADTIPAMLRDELFADDSYHVDVSHLSSVVQMAIGLPATEQNTLGKVLDLCRYGQKLAPQFQGHPDSPFDTGYNDYAIYCETLLGTNTDLGVRHFETKIANELEDGNTYPAEVFVNLLLKLDRKSEALAAAKRYFAQLTDDRGLSCPGVDELSRMVGDYAGLTEAARKRGDAVTFLAGLIASNVR